VLFIEPSATWRVAAVSPVMSLLCRHAARRTQPTSLRNVSVVCNIYDNREPHNMEVVTNLYTQYATYAKTYDALWWIDVMNRDYYPHVPIAVAILYIAFVFAGQAFMKDRSPPPLKWVIVFWNLFLAVFSIAGAIVYVPYMANILYTKGFHYAMCEHPANWFYKGEPGIWINLFVASKIPEMFDTVLLVLNKKPVIFLHWYHHFSVMLFAWNSWYVPTAPSVWYAAMNYSVHAFMYSYYFMMSFSATTRKMVRPFAQFITSIQILQMVWGFAVSVVAGYYLQISGKECQANTFNNTFAIVMYFSYLILFSMLFKKMYLTPKGKGAKKAEKKTA
jgi:hypothetical protein